MAIAPSALPPPAAGARVKRAVFPALLAAAIAIAAASEFLAVRRNLFAQRAAIDDQWNELSAAFDRRASVIASLAARIRPAAANPNDPAFADAASASSDLAQAQSPQAKIEANARLTNALARIYLAAEGRRKLTSSPAYHRLDEEIGNAESSVAIERRKYNDLLEHYNAQLQQFPDNIVAALGGFTRIDAYVRTEQQSQ
jgi:LemA protein